MGSWFRNPAFFKGIGIALLLVTSLFWILSLTGVLLSSWATALGAIIAVLAIFLAFLQWAFPLSVRPKDQPYETLLRQFKSLPTMNNGTAVIRTLAEEGREIYATQCPPEVLAKMRARKYYDEARIIERIAIDYNHITAFVENHTMHGELIQLALFPSLGQGEYLFWTPRVSVPQDSLKKDYSSYTTVQAGQVTELDWRYGGSILQLK